MTSRLKLSKPASLLACLCVELAASLLARGLLLLLQVAGPAWDDSAFTAKINRYHVCRQVLPSPWILRVPSDRPSRNSPRASIFELASVLNEARARKAGDLPSSRRKGIVRVAKG
jgi:hypothetical protein